MKKLFRSFWFNVLFIVTICFALYFAFFASLSMLTNHGKSTNVPQLKGKKLDIALKELEKQGFKVSVDSVFDPTKKGMEVIDVQPQEGSIVKQGRTIFLIVNKMYPPEVDMPNLVNLSFRSAQLILESNKLVLGDTIFKPDMAKGAVLQQLLNGVPIRPGQKIKQGTRIDLVVGDGLSNVSVNVPNLINLPYREAIKLLNASNIFITEVWDGSISDSSTAVVYFQMPAARNEQGYPNTILEGENMDIRIRQQPLSVEETNENPQ
ncbi:penicillin-binding protein [Taibaiella sp. KBW10]|uniref:PASTA domain-containing protein n=1 Tax=Taibaiella sp. KBW10 TaxID=2153357 RepID=UPI000F5A9EA3|nr:PASTA domain-containing protein [Taibaiella sp. KBW10]RQO31444.1 penicillin-binding protein [Taibaiella sp. KBW10]